MSQILTGTVVSNKMINTIVVDVARKFQHPRLRKTVNLHKKIKVHAENADVKVGDVVRIRQTRPISKDKHFILITEIDQNAKAVQEPKQKAKKEEAQAKVKVEAAKKVPKKTTTRKTTTKSKKVNSTKK